MNKKQQAYNLFNEGLSYKEIASKLDIGKTTAYDYVKEIRLTNQPQGSSIVPNGSELIPNERSERKNVITKPKLSERKSIFAEPTKINVPNVPNSKTLKGFTGNDLLRMKFDTLEFDGKFLELIGKPEKRFSGIIWGLPKGGKSNLSLRFADYLQEYHGKVLYVAAEEGMSISMQDKIKAIGGSDVTFLQSRNRDEIKAFIKESPFDFVFIDSINVVGIDDAFLESIKQENPKKSFVAIVQATKGGNFKGEQSLEHNCDFVIKVVQGIAYHKGRFGPESEVAIFLEPMYIKNSKQLKVLQPIVKSILAASKIPLIPMVNIEKSAPTFDPKTFLKEYIEKNKGAVEAIQTINNSGPSILKNILLFTGGIYLGIKLYENNDSRS